MSELRVDILSRKFNNSGPYVAESRSTDARVRRLEGLTVPYRQQCRNNLRDDVEESTRSDCNSPTPSIIRFRVLLNT